MEYMCDYSVLPKTVKRVLLYYIGDHFRCTNETRIIKLEDGEIKGVKRRTVYDFQYFSFEGIPYGKPPIGKLRFKASLPVEPWTGIKDCTKGCKVPIQYAFPTKFVRGSEDCLYLNVYTKSFNSEKPLPVLVFIPGGGFQLGEASRNVYGPDYLMAKDIVLVVINYRIGALGFLSFKDPNLNTPGNAGFHDQILALRWLQKNIKHFNGDPNNVTVMGQSAGAVSTHYLMCFEQSRDLFHKAILLSGSTLVDWATFPPGDWGYRLACELDYKGSNIDNEVLEFLSKVNAKKIRAATQNVIKDAERRQLLLMNYGPTIEPYIGENSLITKTPAEMLKTAWGNKLPLIFGFTSFEGLGFLPMLKKYPFFLDDLGDCENLVPIELRTKTTKIQRREIGLDVKRLYFGNVKPNYKEHFFEFLDAMSYALVLIGVFRNIPARLHYASKAPSYLFRFDFDSFDFNHCRQITCGTEIRGAAHSDECSYIFYNCLSHKLSKNSAEFLTIERMVGIITSFMETSDPNCKEIESTNWKPLENQRNVQCLNIKEKLEMIELPEKLKYEYWSRIFGRYGEF